MTRRQIGKWALYALGGTVALVVLLRISAGLYLATPAGKAKVARQLEGMIGLPVEVSEVQLGSGSTSLAFRVVDPNQDRTSPGSEILTVESATADSSLASLAVGGSPSELKLQGVQVNLRLDADGKLLTTLPKTSNTDSGGSNAKSIPTVRIDHARLVVHQVGRPTFQLEGISLQANPAGDTIVLTGAVDDAQWGRWTVNGEIATTPGTGWLELKSPATQLDTTRLRSIPAVSASVWDNVQPAGPADASIRFAIEAENRFAYDVRIHSRSATLGIPAAEITLQETACNVRIHDGLIEVSGEQPDSPATAKLAGGDVEVRAKWDFGREPSVGDPLSVKVRRLAVKDLPETWGLKNLGGSLPGKLSIENGFLSGSATIKLVTHADGRIETFGGGRGRVELPNFLGGSGAVGVKLGGTGRKLEFSHLAGEPPPKEAPPKQPVSIEVQNPRELFALIALLNVQPPDEPTNLDAVITLRDIDIAQLIEQLQITLPYKLAGKVTVRAKFGVPLAEVTSSGSYQLTGTLTSPELRFEGLTIRDLTTEIVYQNGKLTLTQLKGRVPQTGNTEAEPGAFLGTASAEIDPPGAVVTKLTLERIPVAQVAAAVPGFTLELDGLMNGQANFEAPFDTLGDMTTWTASASLRSGDLSVAGRKLRDFSVGASLSKGVLSLKDTAVTVEGIPITARGTLTLREKYPFEATLRTEGTRITDLGKLIPEANLPAIEGALDSESKCSGTLAPATFAASGRVTATKLSLGKTSANQIEVKWTLDENRVRITELAATVFGGTVSGSLDYPFDRAKAGDFNLGFKNVDAAAVAAFAPDIPVKISGAVTGSVKGTIAPAKNDAARIGNLDLDLSAPKLTVQNVPAERLTGKAAIRDGAVDYSLEGKTLGGSFEVKGRYPGAKKGEKSPRGMLRLRDLDLARLGRDLKMQSLAPLRGRVDATFDYENDLSAGAGRLFIQDFGWGSEGIAQDLSGVLLLHDGVLELRDLAGSIARGTLRARARVNLDNPARNFVSIAIDRADAARLFAPIPELDGITGQASVVIRATLGRTMRGSGTLTLARGGAVGIALDEVRVPFDFSTSPGGGGRVAIREMTTRAGTGRATGALTIDWGSGAGARVAGQVRFIDLPLRVLSPSLGDNAFLGAGKITGRFDLSGSNVRSANDVSGTLVAALNNTSVKEIPLLQRTVPYLNPAGATKPFQSGDVRATLYGGIFRIQRLALANPGAQIFAEGTVRTTGSLDLDVVAHTGQVGPDSRGLALFALRIPALGPIPIGLIRDVSAFLSNRTIRLSVTGTASNPVVRVNTGALLSEEAVRFFLTRYVLPAQATGALGIGTAGAVYGSSR
jgi:translocation and assembly module TamB